MQHLFTTAMMEFRQQTTKTIRGCRDIWLTPIPSRFGTDDKDTLDIQRVSVGKNIERSFGWRSITTTTTGRSRRGVRV